MVSAAPVNAMMPARSQSVGPVLHTRNPYSSVTLTQMKWKGTVSHSASSSIAARFANANRNHAASIRVKRCLGHSRSDAIDAIPLPADGLDEVGAELGPEPAHVDVDDVRARVEVIAPHRGQQPLLRHRLARLVDQLLEQEELTLRQQHRSSL